MKIGCISLVRFQDNKLLAINCRKGRGIILPGGLHEEGETYKEAALRELQEETGAIGYDPKFVFGAPDGTSFCMAFEIGRVLPSSIRFGIDLGSGVVVAATIEELLQSHFRSYYECLFDKSR